METLRSLFACPQIISLSLHENHFDVYQHLAAPVFLDLLQTALRSTVRAERPDLAAEISIRSIAIRFRYGVAVNTPAVETVLIPDEGNFLKFKIARGRLVFATGRVELSKSMMAPQTAIPLVKASSVGKPVVYEWDLPIRNNDRDPSRNINPGCILDGVFTSRWYFLKQTVGADIDDWIREGVGFFLADAKIDYFQPVRTLGYLKYASWVSEVRADETGFTIPFEVRSAQDLTLHAQGQLGFAVMDLREARVRKQALPSFVKRAFLGN